MAVTSYPTPLDSVSSDIDEVGGKDAHLGMIREDRLGRRYILSKMSTDSSGDGSWLCIDDFSGLNLTFAHTCVPFGANTTGKTVASGQYFWCMVDGWYVMSVTSTVIPYTPLQPGTTSGLADPSIINVSGGYFCGMALAGRTNEGLVLCEVKMRKTL